MPHSVVTHKPSGKPIRRPSGRPRTSAPTPPSHTLTRPSAPISSPTYARGARSSQRIQTGIVQKRAQRVQSALKQVKRAYKSPSLTAPFTPDKAASLIRSVGGSKSEARDLSTKVTGESGGNPRAIGHDPGGTTGLGLWQLTTGVGNDDLINRHGGPQAMLKPKPNAKAALELYRSGGLANWYAPSTAPGTPRRVGSRKPPARAVRVLKKAGVPVPRPTKGAKAPAPREGKVPSVVKIGHQAEHKFGLHVGENPAFGGVTPVHVSDSYHYQRDSKGRGEAIDVSGTPDKMMAFDHFVAKKYGPGVTELFYDPGISIKNGQPTSSIGGHSDHVHVAVAEPGSHFSGSVSGGGSSGGGGSLPASAVSAYADVMGMSIKGAQGVAQKNPALIRRKLAKIGREFASSSSGDPSAFIAKLSRSHGSPVV